MAIAQGNVYVDPAYTSQEAIDALGGTSSITGESLTYGATATDVEGGANAIIPGNSKKWITLGGQTIYAGLGYTMYLSNYNVDGDSFYSDGTYGLYLSGSSCNYLYGVKKSAGTYSNGIDITVVNSLIRNTLAPGSLRNDIIIEGDVKVNVIGSTVNSMIIGGGTTYQQYGTINGNVKFNVENTNVTNGDFHIHSGKLYNGENDEELSVVTGTVTNVNVSGSFRGIQSDSGQDNRVVKAKYNVTLSGVSVGNDINIGYFNNPADWTGSYTLTLAGATASNFRGNGNGDAPDVEHFDLILGASEIQTVTGTIDRFKAITVEAGANVQANSITGATLMSVNKGAVVSTAELTVGTLAIYGEFTAVNNTIISGLENFTVDSVLLNDVAIEYGFMPGQYSLVGDKLILHQGETVLVNSSYIDGQDVTYGEKVYKGYKTVASAQAAISPDDYMITVVPVDDTSIEGDIVTKNYGVVIQGDESNPISMNGKNLVIGETGTKQPSSTVVINGLSSVGTISFGDLDATFVTATSMPEVGAIDLRGANIGDADITVSNATVTNIYLPTANSIEGSFAVTGGKIDNIFNSAESDGKLALSFDSKTSIENVYAEGKNVNVGDATVTTYIAGTKAGGAVDSISFEATKNANISNLVLGGEAASTIGSVTAKIGGSGIAKATVGGESDTITGDVTVELTGPVGVAPASSNFTGITYGAQVGELNGNTEIVGGKATLNVTGHSKVNAITGFDVINVTGGTLNAGDNGIDGDAAITNRRTISTKGNISASTVDNSGAIGADTLSLTGSLLNTGLVRVNDLTVGGDFNNQNTIYSFGSLSVGGVFTNSGVIYTGNSEDDSLTVNGDLVNEGLISTGKLQGVANLTTSSLFVTGDASITGNITVTADSRVSFLNGVEFSGNVEIDASSTLTVGGESFSGSGTITINVGDLIGFNEVVVANGGLNDWTIKLAGANSANYSLVKTETSVLIYSTDTVFVNSKFAEDSDCYVDGNKLLFGKNAFASVADAVKAAKAGAKIVITGDKTGMAVDAANFDVVLDNSVVGDVTAKTIAVTSDSKANSIVSASKLTIDAGALLTVTDTVPAALPIVIDASEGSGSRLVLDVDSTKVTIAEANVTVLSPAGKTYGKLVLAGEAAHAGDLYLISNDIVYFAPNLFEEVLEQGEQIFEKDGEGNLILDETTNEPIPVLDANGNPTYEVIHTGVYAAKFVDGDTFDKATGDALFATLAKPNVFQVKDDAAAAAREVSGTLVIVDHLLQNMYGYDDITMAFESDLEGVSGVNRSIYGISSDHPFVADSDHTFMILGSTTNGNVYPIGKKVTIGKDYTYTFIADGVLQTDGGRRMYVVNSDVSTIDGTVKASISNSAFANEVAFVNGGGSVVNGDIYAKISGSTFANGLNLITNNHGSTVNGNVYAEISGTSINTFHVGYGTFGTDETAPTDVNVTIKGSRIGNVRGFRLSEDAAVLPVLNTNLNLTILDTTITDAFYAVYTGDWDGGSGVRLRYTAYNSGSITVTLGGVSIANQIHGGDSLTHSRNALQNFNIPTELHIVAGETNRRTTAAWVMEWETIVVDANATFWVNNDIQYLSGDVTGRIVNDGQPALIKINMAGYEGGTNVVVRANNIYASGSAGDRPGIQVIGNEDITGRYELVLVDSGNLTQIGVFDKAGDVYLNSTYNSGTSGNFSGDQVLYYGYNALDDADEAAMLTEEWGGDLYVTGGKFEDEVSFGGKNAYVLGGTLVSLSGLGSDTDLSITVSANTSIDEIVATTATVAGNLTVTLDGAGKVATDIDGVKDSVTGIATLDVKTANAIGDVSNFDVVKVAKGKEVTFGALANSTLSIFADNTIFADSITLGSDVITIDVTGYEEGPRALVVTTDGITDYDRSKIEIVGGEGFDVAYKDGILSLLTSKKTDVYLNSTYSAETTGSFYDGVYLDYGFNAFSDFDAAAAGVGEGYSIVMTGGEYTDTFTLDGVSFVLKGGVVGEFAAGANPASLTIEGNATVTDGINDLSGLTLYANTTLTADHIDLVDGSKIIIKAAAFKAESGNLHKVIDTVTGISGATYEAEGGVYVYYQNNDLFLMDTSRIYLDTGFTSDVTGTTAANGDTLVFGVNAFNSDTAAYAALVTGGTLYVSNWGTAGSQAPNIAPGKPASIIAQGPTNFSVIANGGSPQVINDDILVVIDNVGGTPQASSRLLGTGGGDNNRWVFNGNVVVTFTGSGRVNTNTDFGISSYAVFNGDLFQINIINKNINDDYWFIRNVAQSDFTNLGKLELNITGVTTSDAAKWTGIFDGDPTLPALHVVTNITDSLYRAGNNDWSVGLVSTGSNSREVIYDVHMSGSTIMGWISGARTSKWNGQPGADTVYNGTRTLYIDGTKTSIVQEAMMFHHIIIDANAQFIIRNQAQFMHENGSGPNTIEIDVSGYTGADKLVLSCANYAGADFDFVLNGNTNGTYIAGLNRSRGAYIITANGDVIFNSNFTTDDNGRAVGNTFVHIDEENPENSNAFYDFDTAKAALDARTALGLERTLYVTGNGENAFYADGYAVTISGGTYDNGVFGNDDENTTVASVDLTIADGQFYNVAVSDESGKVTGDARITIAGGTFGIPAKYVTPEATEDNPNPEPELTDDEVPATIDGAKEQVGGVSSLFVTKALTINGSVVNFDESFVDANLTVTGNFESDTITIDASSLLTVEGDIVATNIFIDASEYVGPTKTIAVSDSFDTTQPTVTIIGDAEVYDYKYVDGALYLVSKNAGNVYLNSTWTEDISGTIYNGELLVWGVNAYADMNVAVEKLTEDFTLFVTGGVFSDTYTFGKAKIDIRDDATTIGGLVLGDGSSVTISGITSGASSIGSITAVEGSTSGYSVTALSQTAFGAISGVNAFTFAAGKNITVTGIDYVEDGGALVVDFADYEGGSGAILKTTDGINNFLQYKETLADGTTVSRTVIGARNNDDRLMPYYDEATKSIIAVEPAKFAFLDPNANNADNGTVVVIDGETTTKVYGYNTSNWNVNVGRYVVSGGTLFADGGETGAFYWFFTAAPINVNVTGITTGGFVAGYNDDSPASEKFRDGDFTAVINASTITWFAAIAGQGNSTTHQEMVVANLVPDDPENPETGYHYEDTVWNITLSNGTHDTNDFRIARYANLSGGTINVTFDNYRLRGDLMLFDRVFNGTTEGVDNELKEINVTLNNVQEPVAKWVQIWEPQDSNSTKINVTITDTYLAGDNTSTIGLFGVDTTGSWDGEADVYISGLTITNGNLNGGRGQTAGGLDNIDGTRVLHVVGGTNRIATVREFTDIEIADGALLTGNSILMSEGDGFVLRGETGYTGEVKEFAVVGTTISGSTDALFLDDNDDEIDGYTAVVGSTSVFIYKPTYDVYYSNAFSDATTGTAITELDGTKNFLVYGDNAVSNMATASASVDERGGSEKATIYVLNASNQSFDTRGYTIVFEGGQARNVWGGFKGDAEEVQASVDTADITVNKGATVTNITAATEMAAVTGDVSITIGDGTTILGTIDGAPDYVGGDSFLTFAGSATVRGSILGFTGVTVDADELVAVGGTVSNAAIVIDTTGFENSSKVVMSAAGFDESVTVTVGSGFDYKFSDDGKSLIVVSPLVGDTFFNTEWTEESVTGLFIGGVELVWNKNAFNNLTGAAAAAGANYSVIMEGGATTESADLAGRDFVAGGTQVGTITSAGATLTVSDDLTAAGLNGFSAIDLASGATLTVSGGISLAAQSKISIDVTGYTQDESDVVLISTASGIENIDSATISVVGNNEKTFYAYYDAEDKSVHMQRIDNFYVDVAYGTAGEGIVEGQTNPITGERLVFGLNAFYYLNDAIGKMAPGQALYINGRIGNDVNTGDRMANIYLTGSTVPVLINGYTAGDQVYEGDVWMTIKDSQIATAAGSFLFGTVTAGEPWNHNQRIFGNMSIDVIGSTIGGTAGAILVTGINYVNVLGTEENPVTITMNFVDSIINDDFTFVGDSPLGKNMNVDGSTYKAAELVLNFNNVVVPNDKWWRIQDGDQESTGTVTVNITNSTIGRGDGEMRFSLGSWQWGDPRNHCKYNFTIENSTIVGYLQSAKHDDGNHAELVNYDGLKSVTLIGDNNIRYLYWFNEINLTAESSLVGREIRMASSNAKINVDITGYTGKSKVLVSMDSAFVNVGDDTIVVTKEEGSTYEVLTSDRSIVIKGAVKDVYVNSTYTAETCPAGTVYNDDLLFFGSNAFSTMAEAITVLPADGSIFVTGGAVTAASLPTNNLTIDASANLTYNGGVAITITDTFTNEGTMTFSTEGFDLSAGKTVALTAGTISGAGTYKVTGDSRYLITREENTLYFVERKVDVFVNTAWEGLENGSVVTLLSGETATIGIDAFASADSAAANVFGGGTITIEAGDVSFTNRVVCAVTALEGVTVSNTNIDNGGSLTISSGAIADSLAVRKGGTLTVESGALLTGTLGLANDSVVTVNGTMNFDLSAVVAGSDALVNNIALVNGAPTYTITVDAAQKDGVYSLAGGAAAFSFTGEISVKTVSGEIGKLTTLGQTENFNGVLYTLDVADGVLTLTKEVYVAPITVTYANSAWAGSADGTVVATGATFGYNAFATGDEAIATVVDYGKVEVLGGTVSFTAPIAKTVTINSGATLAGIATFTTPISIDGTVAFDTTLATAEAAQINGLSFVSGNTSYTLTGASAEGVYLLATDAAAFASDITFGKYTLKLDETVIVDDAFAYTLSITEGNALALTVAEYVPPVVVPTLAYVNSQWASKPEGSSVTIGTKIATIGYDAFATLQPAIDAVTDDGAVEIAGGTISFADGYSKTITVDAGATVVGTATFDKAITINGTVAFSTANATSTDAQFEGFSFVSGTATYTLAADAVVGTYLLASDAATFNSDVQFNDVVLKVGAEATVIGDFTYALAITDNNELALLIGEKPVPPTPTDYVAKSDIDGNGISDVMFVWTGNNYQHGYWMNGTSEWQSAGSSHPAEWENLGCYDMTGNGKADSVLVGNVTTETTGKGAYIGFYTDAIDNPDGSTWQNIGYLTNVDDIAWKNKVGNLTGGDANSIVWYAPELYALGAWTDGTESWVTLTNDFGGDDWTLVGCGDFDGNGKDSVVMSGLNGQYFYIVGIDEAPKSLGNANWASWEVRAIGDFSGDGKDDIVLFHSEYGSMVMLADGNLDNYTSIGQLDAQDWFVVGAGDYNNDQKDDLLVRQYSTGMLGYYNSGDTMQWVELGRGVDMNWTVIA